MILSKKVNNKGADQPAQKRSLVCAFVVHKPQRQVFSRWGQFIFSIIHDYIFSFLFHFFQYVMALALSLICFCDPVILVADTTWTSLLSVSKKPHFFIPKTFLVHPNPIFLSSEHSLSFATWPEIRNIHYLNISVRHTVTYLSRIEFPTSVLRVGGWYFSFYFKFNRPFYMQTLKTLIRRRVLQCPIWVWLLAYIPTKRVLRLKLYND